MFCAYNVGASTWNYISTLIVATKADTVVEQREPLQKQDTVSSNPGSCHVSTPQADSIVLTSVLQDTRITISLRRI